jgi:hypothetical protein
MHFKKHIHASDMPGQLFFVGVTGDVDDETIRAPTQRGAPAGRRAASVANDPVPVR